MRAWVERGLLPVPDPDLAADMYAWAGEELARADFVHYEISNWARRTTPLNGGRSDAACRHNLQYWRNLPYLGFGAGAHGFAGRQRYANIRSPRAYIRRMSRGLGFDFPLSPAGIEQTAVSSSVEMNETMMLGLRLLDEGVDEAAFASRFGVEIDEAFPRRLGRLQEDGLITREDGRLRLTERAYFIANQVFCMFV
jgi:oxygen-independent coproporphyrinogen-3 oxidase